MKKSEVVLLTLMAGVVVAANVERKPDTVRNVYNTRDDCVQDYSDTQCEEKSGSRLSGGGSSSGRWVGPEHRDGDNTGRGNHASGHQVVRRGGFGFSGRGSSG